MLARVERLCKTSLNGKNFIKAVNKHAVSLINYYVELLSKNIGITESVESYIQTILLKKTLESISFEYRRGAECLDETEDKSIQSREQEHVDVAQAYPVQTD
ncbi:hypothetical protein PAEPH01_2145 [Pancytospora epiphaga]|nr:hypothetical protein PAEPH01_2145 [Pancytospora epiphaga]